MSENVNVNDRGLSDLAMANVPGSESGNENGRVSDYLVVHGSGNVHAREEVNARATEAASVRGNESGILVVSANESVSAIGNASDRGRGRGDHGYQN